MDFTKYNNTLPYPEKPVLPRITTSIRSISNAYAIRIRIEELTAALPVFEQYERDLSGMRAQRDAYRQRDNELFSLFKKDLFDELGIADHPKREELFVKAWEMGHSSGCQEVYNYALDLVGLIK